MGRGIWEESLLILFSTLRDKVLLGRNFGCMYTQSGGLREFACGIFNTRKVNSLYTKLTVISFFYSLEEKLSVPIEICIEL